MKRNLSSREFKNWWNDRNKMSLSEQRNYYLSSIEICAGTWVIKMNLEIGEENEVDEFADRNISQGSKNEGYVCRFTGKEFQLQQLTWQWSGRWKSVQINMK